MGVALPVMGVVAGLAGAGVSAAGSYMTGQANSEAAAYQAQVARNNAVIARQNATTDIQAGEAAAVNEGLKTRARLGQEKAAQGASGIDVNTGSAADVRAGTDEIGMLQAMTIRSNAAKTAYSDQVQASSQEAQAQLDTMESEKDQDGAVLGSLGTLLSGASSVGASWRQYQKF